ncbi:MAG: Nudix family hydrolase [Gammaproteobacteria bacterium]|nr:MAG: Nudix family hydrolase [Gammaproteobacteria bacterium]
MLNVKRRQIHVVAAVIRNGYGKILLAQRSLNCPHLPGYWEFPGGKVEEGETALQALVRELQEELAITATKLTPLIQVPYFYPEKDIFLDVWEVDQYIGEVKPHEGQDLVFVDVDEIDNYQLPAADIPVVTALRLPNTYLITPEPADYDMEGFELSLRASLQSGVRLVQLRSKKLGEQELEPYLQCAKDICREFSSRLLINGDVGLYRKYALDGVHLTSSQLNNGKQDYKKNNKDDLIAASCHSVAQLQNAEKSGVDFALLSPVKHTKTHPDATPIGWQTFADAVKQVSLPVYALGGLGLPDLNLAKQYGAQGIAAIRGLWRES